MRLFSRIYGEGPPLIIIHGLFGMSDNWNAFAKRFSHKFNVHVIDLRNHGRSPHSEKFNYHLISNDILRYIDHNNLERPIIFGHSLGGKVAMKIGFAFPERIEKLIIVDICPRTYEIEFHQNILLVLSKIDLQAFSHRKEIDMALSAEIKQRSIRDFLLKNLYRNKNKDFEWRFNIKSLSSELTNINEPFYVDQSCHIPTCFMKGADSNYIESSDEHFNALLEFNN